MRTLGTVFLIIQCVLGSIVWSETAVPTQPDEGAFAPLTPEEQNISDRLKRHVEEIASVPHNLAHSAHLEKAARYIEATLVSYGYSPERQVYDTEGQSVRNIWVVVEPTSDQPKLGALVIGAHYDSFGNAPGANDNGTGTAAVLELARLLQKYPADNASTLFSFLMKSRPISGQLTRGVSSSRSCFKGKKKLFTA